MFHIDYGKYEILFSDTLFEVYLSNNAAIFSRAPFY